MLADLHMADHTAANGVRVFEVEGEIDLHTASAFKARTWSLVSGEDTSFIIDLTKVTFMNSMGFAVLIGALKRVRAADGQLVLVLNPTTERLFRMTGLAETFEIYATTDAALLALTR